MITELYNTILAVPVVNEHSPLEPFIYTAVAIAFPVLLMFFLQKTEDKKKLDA